MVIAITKNLIVTAILALCAAAHAEDVSDLEDELPMTIEDAIPNKPGSVELDGGLRYQRMRSTTPGQGRHEYQLTPRVQIGVAQDFQVSIAAPYRLGTAEDTSQGEFRLDGLYKLNSETRYQPAFAIGAGIEQPFGANSGGAEVLIKGIMTKSLGESQNRDRPVQVHVNLVARHNLDREDNERRNRYLIGAALSKQLSERWLIATSLFREQERERNKATNMAELGARWKLSEKTILSGAIGRGINQDAPLWRFLMGVQRSLD
jgi:hypothetical protein